MNLTDLRDRVMRRLDWMEQKPQVEDVDSAMNTVQRLFIQPSHREVDTVDFTVNSKKVDLDDIAENIYRIESIHEIRNGEETGKGIPVNNYNAISSYGARVVDGSIIFSSDSMLGKTYRFVYRRKLRDLGTAGYLGEVTVPDIDEQWHDLYWLGAVAEFDDRQEPRFSARMRDYEIAQRSDRRPRGWTLRARSWR